jgi:hypothetical protein
LFDNSRCKRPVLDSFDRPLTSLTDRIRGKHGKLRKNLLSKRVDYSARSVIVVGPELKLHQCGLPRKIALELFQPFIIRRIWELRHAETIVSCKQNLNRPRPDLWDVLDEVIRNHPVLLNHAPTLQRMAIQAFEPILVDGNAISIHPLVSRAFSAEFDGDQMTVHLPLSIEARAEAMTLMMPANNLLSPANGNPNMKPTADIVAGTYYLTASRPSGTGERMMFASSGEVFLAHGQGKVGTHTPIKLRLPAHKQLRGTGEITYTPGKIIETTVGRVVFNDILRAEMPFYNLTLGQEQLQSIIADCDQIVDRRETIGLLDRIKELGFRESTRSGLSFAIGDLRTAPFTAAGDNIEAPTNANLREGLSMLAYFKTAQGERNGLIEKSAKTASSRSLARKLAEVAQDVVISMEDCGTTEGIAKDLQSVRGRASRVCVIDPNNGEVVAKENEMITPAVASKVAELQIEKIQVRSPMTCQASHGFCRLCYGMDLASGQLVELGTAVGIIAAQSISEHSQKLTMPTFPREVGSAQHVPGGLPRVTELFEARRLREPAVIAETDGLVELLDEKRPARITIMVRSVRGIDREHLVRRGKCLRVKGGDRVRAGDPLVEGTLAPHDILRVSGEEAVRHYLLQQLQNEYRSHHVQIDDKHLEIIIARMLGWVRVKSHGDTSLLPGSLIAKFKFRTVNQELMNCVKIKDSGDTDLRPGDIVPRDRFERENLRAHTVGARKAEKILPTPASGAAQLFGITKAAMLRDGFLSAASFQEATKVLTEAALGAKIDTLLGLKENVIVGHLIPAGTGFETYVNAEARIRPEASARRPG